jgi:hypothetical protein
VRFERFERFLRFVRFEGFERFKRFNMFNEFKMLGIPSCDVAFSPIIKVNDVEVFEV